MLRLSSTQSRLLLLSPHVSSPAQTSTFSGYDSVFKKKTHEKCEDGVATFYKRTRYQLFQSAEIKFNDATRLLGDANDKARAMTDDVALILGLQPWEDSTDPSAICVVNAHLQAGGPGMSKTRLTQSRFLINEVEKFNSTFAMPIIIGGCLNTVPKSDLYHIFRTGSVFALGEGEGEGEEE